MTLCCVYLMATIGLNLTVGYAGQMSLGQAAFFGIGAYIAAIALKAGWPFFVVLPIAAVACFAVGLALGLPGAARAAPLPRVRHARVQRPGLPRDAQRGEDHRRHVRHLGHPAAVALRLSPPTARSRSSTSRWRRSSSSRFCCGGCCARHGGARSRRCATIRSAPRASASTSRPTRCSPSRSAPPAPASAASTTRRSSSSSSPDRSTSRRRS